MDQKKSQGTTLKVNQIIKSEFAINNSNTLSKNIKNIINVCGNALPIVVSKTTNNNEYNLVHGQAKLNEVIASGYDEIPACIIEEIDDNEITKAILNFTINDIHETDVILESKLLNDLVKNGVKRADIIKFTGKSKSWLSKRLSLYNNLDPSVQELVRVGKICPKKAEEIAKLPKDVQLQFAQTAIDDELNYIEVSLCVNKYNDNDTSSEIKQTILENPTSLDLKKEKQTNKKKDRNKEKDITEDIRTVSRLVNGLNKRICSIEEEKLLENKENLETLQKHCETLINHIIVLLMNLNI
jgi:ParB-like chromosome segregation protein Spo0J